MRRSLSVLLSDIRLGRISRQRPFAKASGLGDYVATAFLPLGDASVAVLLAFE
jgi:hypothetical protein